MNWNEIPHFEPASYSIHMPWNQIERWLEGCNEDGAGGYNLDPVWQRGYVWTREQQIAFLEHRLMGGMSGGDIFWNAPEWGRRFTSQVSIVDGKQRLTAVREFMMGRLPVFGKLHSQFEGQFPLMDRRTMLTFHINNLVNEADVIRWYLSMNTGGSVHTPEEIARVRALLG